MDADESRARPAFFPTKGCEILRLAFHAAAPRLGPLPPTGTALRERRSNWKPNITLLGGDGNGPSFSMRAGDVGVGGYEWVTGWVWQ